MNEALKTINLASGIVKLNSKEEFYQSYFQRFINDSRITEKTSKNYVTYLKHFAKWIKEEAITNPQRDDIRNYQRHLDSYISNNCLFEGLDTNLAIKSDSAAPSCSKKTGASAMASWYFGWQSSPRVASL